MRTINVLATQRISADDRAKIEASDPEIRLIDAGGWFDGEIAETWTAFAAARYRWVTPSPVRIDYVVGTEEYLNKMLAEPFPPFTFSASGASVYQLGSFDTARKELRMLTVTLPS